MLKNSLEELMQHKSIEKISVSELCSKACINRTTFYNHYGSQYDVLADIGNELINGMNTVCTKENSEDIMPLNEQIEMICNYLSENKKQAQLLFHYYSSDSDFANKCLKIRLADAFKQTEPLNYSESEWELVKVFLSNGIYSVIVHWIDGNIPITSTELGNLALHISTKGWINTQ